MNARERREARYRAFLRDVIGVDGPPQEPSLRTLGTGETQALPGLAAVEGGVHPDLAAHASLGLVADDHAHDTTHTHADLATDAELTTHADTDHGLSLHALDGAFHSNTEALPTTGQKNALAGTNGTPGDSNRFVTNSDSRLSDSRDPTAHTHNYADPAHSHDTSHTHTEGEIPASIARDSEVTAAISAHLSGATHGGGGGGEHPDLATHDELGLATDADLTAHGSGSHVTQQPAIANLVTSGNASTQTANLQAKVAEILTAMRNAGVIQS